jgi:steroid 5-alpha reductase family enzyme
MTSQLDAILAAGAVAFVCFFAAWAWGMLHGRDVSVTDVYYGFAPITQGLVVYVLWHRHSERGAILLALTALWSIGLGQLLISRVRANHGFGGEPRFLLALEKYKPGKHLWWISLLILVLVQAVLVTVLNLPLLLTLTSKYDSIAVIDVVGYLVLGAGAVIEVVGNLQLERFRNDPRNKGKGRTLNAGLWAWSRHPNYFGNVLCYWGFFVVAIRDPHLWFTAIGPLAIYGLLRFGSGVKLTEFMMLEKRKGDPVYADYLARTSPFMLRPPRRPGIRTVVPPTGSEGAAPSQQ